MYHCSKYRLISNLTGKLLQSFRWKIVLISFPNQRFHLSIYRNPTEDQIFNYIDQLVDLNDVLYPNEPRRGNAKKRNLAPFRISQIIQSCHENQSMFEVT